MSPNGAWDPSEAVSSPGADRCSEKPPPIADVPKACSSARANTEGFFSIRSMSEAYRGMASLPSVDIRPD